AWRSGPCRKPVRGARRRSASGCSRSPGRSSTKRTRCGISSDSIVPRRDWCRCLRGLPSEDVLGLDYLRDSGRHHLCPEKVSPPRGRYARREMPSFFIFLYSVDNDFRGWSGAGSAVSMLSTPLLGCKHVCLRFSRKKRTANAILGPYWICTG